MDQQANPSEKLSVTARLKSVSFSKRLGGFSLAVLAVGFAARFGNPGVFVSLLVLLLVSFVWLFLGAVKKLDPLTESGKKTAPRWRRSLTFLVLTPLIFGGLAAVGVQTAVALVPYSPAELQEQEIRAAEQARLDELRKQAEEQRLAAEAALRAEQEAEEARKKALREAEEAEKKAQEEAAEEAEREREEAKRLAEEQAKAAEEEKKSAAEAARDKQEAAERDAAEKKKAADKRRKAAEEAEREKQEAAERDAAEKKKAADKRRKAAEKAERDKQEEAERIASGVVEELRDDLQQREKREKELRALKKRDPLTYVSEYCTELVLGPTAWSGSPYLEVAQDGSSLFLSSQSSTNETGNSFLYCSLDALEISASLRSAMSSTNSLQGVRVWSENGYSYEWSFHPSVGFNLGVIKERSCFLGVCF